jgi:hypothetical protein
MKPYVRRHDKQVRTEVVEWHCSLLFWNRTAMVWADPVGLTMHQLVFGLRGLAGMQQTLTPGQSAYQMPFEPMANGAEKQKAEKAISCNACYVQPCIETMSG